MRAIGHSPSREESEEATCAHLRWDAYFDHCNPQRDSRGANLDAKLQV